MLLGPSFASTGKHGRYGERAYGITCLSHMERRLLIRTPMTAHAKARVVAQPAVERSLLEALIRRHGLAVVPRLRRDVQRALLDVRRGFLLGDDASYASGLLALEGAAASLGAPRIVMICRGLEGQRQAATTAPGLDQLQWEAERVLDVLNRETQRGSTSDVTLRRGRDRTGSVTRRDSTSPPGSRSLRRPA
jgi:HPt (histidine-containing phosphotransfer) domain-containing protein